MNKKILLGSIIAVVILVLVSFTGVVGYQTTKSSTISKASPLFSVRSKRAIDEESNVVTSDYVGKGEEIALSIPKRDNKTELVQKFIKSINRMSDETLENFISLFINQAQKDKRIDSENLNNIKELLHSLRDGDITLLKFKPNINNKHILTFISYDCCFTYDWVCEWSWPILKVIIGILLATLLVPLIFILFILHALTLFTCGGYWCL